MNSHAFSTPSNNKMGTFLLGAIYLNLSTLTRREVVVRGAWGKEKPPLSYEGENTLFRFWVWG